MGSLADDDLDGVREARKYPDATGVRVFCMRTDRAAYPSGWAYTLHDGATTPDPPRTLADGTIRRYDNSHEGTNGHELHVAPDPEPDTIACPGMPDLWERFWREIPKSEFEITCGSYTQVISHDRIHTPTTPDRARTTASRNGPRRHGDVGRVVPRSGHEPG